jgi:CubicO group peptidase (beta-lactamase class C family)
MVSVASGARSDILHIVSNPRNAAVSSPDATALVALAQRGIDRGDVPACQLAIARDGALVLFEALGACTTSTRFCIYSATKPLVASAVWFLIGDGSLDVDAPVAAYIPEFAANGKQHVTVEQVLLHTAGFPRAPITPEEGADPESRVARLASWPLEWEPGSRFEYHGTSAHWVLAELLHRLGGMDFRDFIEQRVCTPLGLPRVLGIGEGDDDDIATPTLVGDGELTEPERDFVERVNSVAGRAAGVPGGGAIMTAAHLALLYQGFLHNPGQLWDPAVLADATGTIRCTFDDPLLSTPVNRSLGLVIAGDDGKHIFRYACFGEACSPRAFGHAGAHGQVGWADPASGISFALVQSGIDPDPFRAGMRAVELASRAASLEW